MLPQQLMRSESDRKIAGVCGGLAEYFAVDAIWVRLAFLVLASASGIGLVIYLILMVVMPDQSKDLDDAIVINSDRLVDDPAALKTRDNTTGTVGVLLILFGAFFLISQLGWISNAFWPLALIGAGMYFIFRRTR